MDPADLTQNSKFLQNPQKNGAWCLRIKLTTGLQDRFSSLLNLEEWHFSRGARRFRDRSIIFEEFAAEMPPIVLIRLFAYLRSCSAKIVGSHLPELMQPIEAQRGVSRAWNRSRYFREVSEMAKPPTRLSSKKKAELAGAVKYFLDEFCYFTCSTVPENLGKIDFRGRGSDAYFQASQEPQGFLKIFSLSESILQRLKNLITSIPGVKLEFEIIRIFSPENTLMELYVPVTRMQRIENLLFDVIPIKNSSQILDEIKEQRFVHAIRATGIAVEELLVEIYETYSHEKAPAAPLGELISSLNSRLKELVSGTQKKTEPGCAGIKKSIGDFINDEKRNTKPNQSVLSLAETLQKSLIPLVEKLTEFVSHTSRLSQKEVKISLFPAYGQRCIGELVSLRNRVSHRVEKASSVTNVGYVEASLALRAYIVLATWWQVERGLINYKQTRKAIVSDSIERSSALDNDVEDGIQTPTAVS